MFQGMIKTNNINRHEIHYYNVQRVKYKSFLVNDNDMVLGNINLFSVIVKKRKFSVRCIFKRCFNHD